MRGEQPVLWYELREIRPGATFEKTSRSWRLRKVGGDSGASEGSAGQENELRETKNSKVFAAERDEKLRVRAPLSPEKERSTRAGPPCRTGFATIIDCRRFDWRRRPT